MSLIFSKINHKYFVILQFLSPPSKERLTFMWYSGVHVKIRIKVKRSQKLKSDIHSRWPADLKKLKFDTVKSQINIGREMAMKN